LVDIIERPTPRRILSLDALRGLSILLMVFSSMIPFSVLPSWMYHAQEPPPNHIFNPNLSGITWVDLVFPFFLFTMGAAIPLALSKKLQQGVSSWKVLLKILYRGILLAGFAIYVMQIRPGVISNDPDWKIWFLGILGFGLLFPILAQLPKSWSALKKYLVRIAGWGGAIIFMCFVRFPDGSGFSVYRSDIIILVLSNVAVFGGVIWLISRDNLLLRISFMGILIALRLSSFFPGWVHDFWNISPFPWLFQIRFLQYLLITIPGTIAGDLILLYMGSDLKNIDHKSNWNNKKLVLITLILFIINVVVVIGMKAQWILGTSLTSIILCLIAWRLLTPLGNRVENLIRTIFKWGVYWLILGFFFEPYEGGIKKDPATLSYYFVTSGLAMFILIVLFILIDIFKLKEKNFFSMLIDSGQNPMIAYAGINNLVMPILVVTKLYGLLQTITSTPWLGVLRGAFITYVVALATTIFTKLKVFLRT
jgi:predicted acyltransferase